MGGRKREWGPALGEAPVQLDDDTLGGVPKVVVMLIADVGGFVAGVEGGVQVIALGFEENPGFAEVGLLDQQVEVAELAQGQVAVEGLGQGRAFEGYGADGVGVEQAEDAEEFGGEVEILDGVGTEELGEFGGEVSARAWWTRGRTPWDSAGFRNCSQSTPSTGGGPSRFTRKHHMSRYSHGWT